MSDTRSLTRTEEALELQVIYRSIQTLSPFARNARTHSRSQIRKLRDSIQSFGFVNPILVNQSGTIIAGHGRVEAAKLLGDRDTHHLPRKALSGSDQSVCDR
jgi:ParB-like chromosome segregation protein Spo0J